MRRNRFIKKAGVLAVACMVAVNGGGTSIMVSAAETETETAAETNIFDETEAMTESTAVQESEKKEPGTERKAKIMVVSIVGNELTYYELKEKPDDGKQSGEDETETKESETEDEQEVTEKASDMNGLEAEEQSEASELKEGEVPDMREPEGGERPDMGEFEGGEISQMPQAGNGGMEQETVYLPVTVVVHTDKGTETGFSILEEGDEIEALFVVDDDGEESITEIWMGDYEDDNSGESD